MQLSTVYMLQALPHSVLTPEPKNEEGMLSSGTLSLPVVENKDT